ncbi:hypothetical protein I4U23_024057 [Adineta vaga]|nr:hypothetical protein I4U23_024057 [Adineta vaga]
MRFIRLLLTLILWIHNELICLTSHATTTTTEIMTDLEDGHPNHQLWKKMIDPGRSLSSDRLVKLIGIKNL